MDHLVSKLQNIEIQSIHNLEISTKKTKNRNPEKQPRDLESTVWLHYIRFVIRIIHIITLIESKYHEIEAEQFSAKIRDFCFVLNFDCEIS